MWEESTKLNPFIGSVIVTSTPTGYSNFFIANSSSSGHPMYQKQSEGRSNRKIKTFERVYSDLDPYGEENWEQ